MRRREFISTFAVGLAAWPLAARAQQPTMPVIGFLNSGSPLELTHFMVAFRHGLEETGYVEGKNVLIEARWAHGQYDQLPKLAADLVGRQVAAIAAGGPPAARAAKVATSTIPVVFTSGDDPVKAGLVSSINRPGGNTTGVYLFLTELNTKKLGLLRDLLPQAKVIAVFLNPTSQNAETQSTDLQAAGNSLGFQIDITNASTELEIEAGFATLVKRQTSALIVGNDPFFISRRDQFAKLAARNAIPAVYDAREYTDAGGLMSYGTSIQNAYRQAGVYIGRILKGEQPGDLPVLRPTKFELVLNLKAARALGVTFPPGLLAIADEVIE